MASQQRALLLGLLDMPLPASLYVSDFNSPDYVSSFVDDVLETHSTRAKHTRVVSVSPQSAPTIPLLAARVLRQLGASKAYDPRLDAARFVARLGPLVTSEKPLILRIDHAERIRDSWPSDFLEILLRLDELCGCPGQLCILFVSSVPYAHLHTLSGRATVLAPIEISLPRVNEEGALQFLMGQADALLNSSGQEVTVANKRALQTVISAAFNTYAADTRDLDEIRTLATTLWLAGARTLKQLPTAERLLTHKELFNEILGIVGSRTVAPAHFVASLSDPMGKRKRSDITMDEDEYGVKQHTVLAAYILMAAYVAGFNPARHDMRFFAQHAGGVQRALRKGQDDEAFAEQLGRPQLIGPQAVSLERLLAVLESLLSSEQPPELMALITNSAKLDNPLISSTNESIPWRAITRSASPLEHISALVASGHLIQLRSGLDNTHYRAALAWEEVLSLASFHHVDIRERLWNWH